MQQQLEDQRAQMQNHQATRRQRRTSTPSSGESTLNVRRVRTQAAPDSDTSSSESGPMVQLGRRRFPNGVVAVYMRPQRPEDRQRQRDRLLAMQQRGYPRGQAENYTIVADQTSNLSSLRRANTYRPAPEFHASPELQRLGEQVSLARAAALRRRK